VSIRKSEVVSMIVVPRRFFAITTVICLGLLVTTRLASEDSQHTAPTINDIAEMMDGTLQRLAPLVGLYSIVCTGPGAFSYRKLVCATRGTGKWVPGYSEEISTWGPPYRTIRVFDGNRTCYYMPNENRATIHHMDIRSMVINSFENIEKSYRELGGKYLPDVLRGNDKTLSVAPIQILGTHLALIQVVSWPVEAYRFLITVSFDHGALPTAIRMEEKDENGGMWKKTVSYEVESWQTLENGVDFPLTCLHRTENGSTIRINVLHVDLPKEIDSILNAFCLPRGCKCTNYETGQSFTMDESSDIGIPLCEARPDFSLFPVALGISLDEAQQIFRDIH